MVSIMGETFLTLLASDDSHLKPIDSVGKLV